jgi:hypothetical protein
MLSLVCTVYILLQNIVFINKELSFGCVKSVRALTLIINSMVSLFSVTEHCGAMVSTPPPPPVSAFLYVRFHNKKLFMGCSY